MLLYLTLLRFNLHCIKILVNEGRFFEKDVSEMPHEYLDIPLMTRKHLM